MQLHVWLMQRAERQEQGLLQAWHPVLPAMDDRPHLRCPGKAGKAVQAGGISKLHNAVHFIVVLVIVPCRGWGTSCGCRLMHSQG